MLKNFFGVKDEKQEQQETIRAEEVPMIQGMEVLSKENAEGKLKSMGIDPAVLTMLHNQ